MKKFMAVMVAVLTLVLFNISALPSFVPEQGTVKSGNFNNIDRFPTACYH